MVKQKSLLLFLFLFASFQFLPISQSYAIVEPPVNPLPPVIQSNKTLFGEDQYYTVTFRGNGEAVINMKAILTNTTADNLTSIELRLPANTAAHAITAYQVIEQPQCVQYSNQPVAQPKCLQYQQPDYQYVSNNTTYKQVSVEQTNNVLTLLLPVVLMPNDTGSYVLSYRTNTYTHTNIFGAYNFTFQTLQVNDPINALTVGITTDSDLYLKGAKGTVNYASISTIAVPNAVDGTMQNPRFNDFYNQMGQGDIVKNASNLATLESYTVTGAYADAGIKLYGKEITITIGAILIFLAAVFGIAMLVLKKKKIKTAQTNTKLFLLATGASFGSIFLASLYTGVMILLGYFITNGNYLYNAAGIFLILPFVGLSAAIYLFLIFTPTILMVVRKGFIWGCITFGLTIMWAVIACIIMFGIFYLFSMSNTTPPPVVRPLMMGATSESATNKAQ